MIAPTCSMLQVVLLCIGMLIAAEAFWYIVIDGMQQMCRELKNEEREVKEIGQALHLQAGSGAIRGK